MRKTNLVFKLFVCVFSFALFFYLYLNRQNELTKLSLRIPAIKKEIQDIKEDNERLQYEIDKFESPDSLIKFMELEEFNHLKYPTVDDVVVVTKK